MRWGSGCGVALEAGDPPWPALEELHRAGQQRVFGEWIEGLRASGELRNDDVTAVLVAVRLGSWWKV